MAESCLCTSASFLLMVRILLVCPAFLAVLRSFVVRAPFFPAFDAWSLGIAPPWILRDSTLAGPGRVRRLCRLEQVRKGSRLPGDPGRHGRRQKCFPRGRNRSTLEGENEAAMARRFRLTRSFPSSYYGERASPWHRTNLRAASPSQP